MVRPVKCPPNLTRRRGYVRKNTGTYVKPTCVRTTRKAATRIGPLRKGELRKYGYSYKLPDSVRRAALNRAIRAKGPLDVYHKLNAVAKLSTTHAPAASSSFAADRNWIRHTYSNANGVIRAR